MLALLPEIDWLTAGLAFFPVWYFSAFCHEAGHAVLGWLSGFQIGSFGLGTGRVFWVGRWRGARMYLGLTRPLQGIAFADFPGMNPSRYRMAAMLAGGVIANALLAALTFGLWLCVPWGRTVWLVTAAVNSFHVFHNLVPFSFQLGTFGMQSDGALILGTLRDGIVRPPTPQLIRFVTGLRPLWEAVGDTLTLRLYLSAMASAWLELGDLEQAERFCADAGAVPAEPLSFAKSQGALVQALVARAVGKVETCARFLDEAERGFRALQDEDGLFIVAWERARLEIGQADAESALQRLEALAGAPTLARWPALRIGVLSERLQVAADKDAAEDVEKLRAEYESTRRHQASDTQDLFVFHVLARYYSGQKDEAKTESAYRQALLAAGRILVALANPADQARFFESQACLRTEAKAWAERLGPPEKVNQIEELFPSPEVLERRQDVERQLHQRAPLAYTLAVVLLMLNLGMVTQLGRRWGGAQGYFTTRPHEPLLPQLTVLAPATALAALLLAVVYVLCSLSSTLRRYEGWLVVVAALVPWVAWGAVVISGFELYPQ